MPLQKWSDSIWLAQMADEPSFSEDIDLLLAQYESAAKKPDVVIDLSGIDLINSTNISQLLRVRRLTSEHHKRLELAGPTNGVWSVFLAASLDKVFRFAPDTMTALAELQIKK